MHSVQCKTCKKRFLSERWKGKNRRKTCSNKCRKALQRKVSSKRVNAYSRLYRLENKEKLKIYDHNNYIKHRKKVLAWQKSYAKTHKREIKRAKSNWYFKNREKILAKQKQQYWETKGSLL